MVGDPIPLRWTFLGLETLRVSWPYLVALVIGVAGPILLEVSRRRRDRLIAEAVAKATQLEVQTAVASVATATPVQPVVQSTPLPVTELKQDSDSKRAIREMRRLKAWEMYQNGISQVEIARELGVTRGAVSQWMKTAREEGGPNALVRKAATGRPSRISPEDLEKLSQMLTDSPRDYGFEADRWSNARVADLIAQKFSVTYHPVHVARLLKKIKSSVE